LDADGAILGDDDRLGAEGIGAAQAGAEIVRIGDAVEDQQQRRLGDRLEHIVERHVRQRVIDDRDDSLMVAVPGQRVEARVIDGMHGHSRGLAAQ
jgi:hypothetical protein